MTGDMNGPLHSETTFQSRGNNTNNFCESAVRVLKDKVLERTKAYNMIPQLADFVSSRLQVYYERYILDVANGRLDNIVTSRYMVYKRNIFEADVKQVNMLVSFLVNIAL